MGKVTAPTGGQQAANPPRITTRMTAPRTDPHSPHKTDEAALRRLLKRHFGHEAFRPLQGKVIVDAIAGRDAFVIMPTGGGKSLCYQLPAVAEAASHGVTIVVSPLISLMQNQVALMEQSGIPATLLNSSVEAWEIAQREAAIVRGDYRLVYLAPERLMSPAGQRLLQRMPDGMIRRFAIDEAHCISEWGHDFRPEYRQLRTLREGFNGKYAAVPLMALTATATPRVAEDIVAQLHLRDPAIHRAGFERTNLFYEVRPKTKVLEQISAYLREHSGDEGIIYCSSRARTEKLADALRAKGVEAVTYHAGLDHETRRKNQDAFIFGDAQLCVATIAFGMGVDKPNVRFVMHADLPRHLEGYYQETGRAGRDGLPADCILFFSPGDYSTIKRFIDEKPSEQERELATAQLNQVMAFARTPGCRMVPLLAYFGEEHPGDCGHCDHCKNPPPIVDATQDAQKLLSAIARTNQRFGLHHVIDVLRGSQSQRITQLRHNELSVFGIGKDKSKTYWLALADHLVKDEQLGITTDGYRTTYLTAASRLVLKGESTIDLPMTEVAKSPDRATAARGLSGEDVALDPEAQALFDRLRTLRRELAREQAVPPYVVFGDAALRAMARNRPTTLTAFARIPGVGRTKLERYGKTFVQAICDHCGGGGAEAAGGRELRLETDE